MHQGWLNQVTDVHESCIVTAAQRGEEHCHHGQVSGALLSALSQQTSKGANVLARGEDISCGAILQGDHMHIIAWLIPIFPISIIPTSI
jgi:hypothetical protein